jgi:predicted lipid-binding transport protein (Tim44 family)
MMEERMKKLFAILAVTFGFTMIAVDTEAARVGGGRSSGRQSSSATNSAAPAQKTAPAQQAAPTPAPAPSGMSRWLGPLAGIAAGIGIASLLSSMGLGGALASILGGLMTVVLLLGVGYFIYRMLTRNKSSRQQESLGYSGAGAGNTAATPSIPQAQPAQFTGNAAPGSLAATLGGAPALNTAAVASRWPADFDAPEFERQAKLNFERLQAANDAGDASTLRDFLTPELYRELESEMKSAWGTQQKTEAVDLRAEVLEVITEGALYVVSVRFTGQIRENGVLSNLSEIWHLEKPVSGRGGWRVSGIQQAS